MMPLKSPQYSDIAQSLRHMPPSNPPLPKENVQQERGHVRYWSITRDDDLTESSSQCARQYSFPDQDEEEEDVRNSIHEKRSPLSSEHDVINQQEDLGLASFLNDTSDFQHHYVFDAGAGVSRDTFDYDYGSHRFSSRTGNTFDFDYAQHYEGRQSRNHLQHDHHKTRTLPTLQQHLSEKWEHCQGDEMQLQQNQVEPAMKPSDRYDNNKKSVIDSTIIDPTSCEDSIHCMHSGVEKMSPIFVLHEIHRAKRKPLPEWLDDVLKIDHEKIDPKVLEELVAATVGGDCDSASATVVGELLEETDTMAHAGSGNNRMVSSVAQQSALDHHFKSEQSGSSDDHQMSMSWPLSVVQDTRGPIPTTDIIGSSFPSLFKPPQSQALSVVEDAHGPVPADDIFDRAISSSSDCKGGSIGSSSYGVQKDNEIGGSVGSLSHGTQKESESAGCGLKAFVPSYGYSAEAIDETQRVTRTIVEDARGPVPDDSIIDRAISSSSDCKGGSIGSSSYGVQKDNEIAGGVFETFAPDYSADDAGGTANVLKCYNRGGSVSSSGYEFKEGSSMATASKTSYSDDRKPPPTTSLSPQSTMQSSQSQSTYYDPIRQSTIEYPSDEETQIRDMPLPPPLRRLSSSSSSFEEELGLSPAGACTKPSLGFSSRPHVRFCEGDIQAEAMKMRKLILGSMRAQQKTCVRKDNNCFHPIDI